MKPKAENQNDPIFDVIIVGAGLSGIGAAYHIQDQCPDKTFAVLEGRSALGGTWDLFNYPGIRSDSDMYTLGFPFYPWKNQKSIADGPSILAYIKETAKVFGIDKKIRFNHKVVEADWSDAEKLWTLRMAHHEGEKSNVIKCRFLFMCSGYYDYREGHNPTFPHADSFQGQVVHPQHWDTSLDYSNKKVIIIGSGATAVTLLPELAKTAEKVTMLQRSPTYIVNLPSRDKVADFLKKVFPVMFAHTLIRWKNVIMSLGFYQAAQKWPQFIKKLIQKGIRKELGQDFELRHFDPKYNPWDERLCLVPDGDFFQALRQGKAEVVTDIIEQFTPEGILLKSGQEIEADLIVTATGLKVQLMGGCVMKINGKTVQTVDLHAYRGVMLSDIPNFAMALGYTNASWTLKCDLNCQYVTRILKHMDQHGYSTCTPRFDPEKFESEPAIDLTAGYIKRAMDILPKQGSKAPWKVYQNYIRDTFSLKYSSVKDKFLDYS